MQCECNVRPLGQSQCQAQRDGGWRMADGGLMQFSILFHVRVKQAQQSAIRNPPSLLWPPACVRVKTDATRRQLWLLRNRDRPPGRTSRRRRRRGKACRRENALGRNPKAGAGRSPGAREKASTITSRSGPKKSSALFVHKTWAKGAASSASRANAAAVPGTLKSG